MTLEFTERSPRKAAQFLNALMVGYLKERQSWKTENATAAENYKKALQLDPDNAKARDGFNEASSRVPPPSDDN